MKIGVVADDITGANDIGGLFTKSGYTVHVYAAEDFDAEAVQTSAPDVCVVDTNSRLDAPDLAYQKVTAATRALRQAGCTRFFNKTCSVFRGNIGVEFDAMLDTLHADFAVVTLGFPRNGRLTLHGIHYVHGQRLEESPFRNDPIHPMRQSQLVDILQAQTQRRVSRIDQDVIAKGVGALQVALDHEREHGGYCILDVADQAALATIARAVAGEPVLCGSSALAEELPAVWGPSGATAEAELPGFGGSGVLCIAGSLTPQTAAQIAFLANKGVRTVAIDTTLLFDSATTAHKLSKIIDISTGELKAGRPVLVYAANQVEQVAATRAVGELRGFSGTEVARRVTDALADVAVRTLERTQGRRLVVAGGETSAAVARRLGIRGMRILAEIQPGVPMCVSLGSKPMLLVFKSGSFGSADFLAQAVAELEQETHGE